MPHPTCDIPFPARTTGRYRKGIISARPSYQGVRRSVWDPETFAQSANASGGGTSHGARRLEDRSKERLGDWDRQITDRWLSEPPCARQVVPHRLAKRRVLSLESRTEVRSRRAGPTPLFRLRVVLSVPVPEDRPRTAALRISQNAVAGGRQSCGIFLKIRPQRELGHSTRRHLLGPCAQRRCYPTGRCTNRPSVTS